MLNWSWNCVINDEFDIELQDQNTWMTILNLCKFVKLTRRLEKCQKDNKNGIWMPSLSILVAICL